MYANEMGRMLAEPCGADDTGPTEPAAVSASGCPGKNGARCDFTPIGPTPGPPPPCGMQKVLWRLRCDTSPPNRPGAHRPTIAFMLAPSMYTWPPWPCTMSQISRTPSSNTPCVEG